MAQNPFLGEISLFAFNFAPQGWAFCNGQLLSITQNTALFSLIGTTYGGDGITTFALPDLRSRVALSFGQGPGHIPYNLGDNGGLESVALTVPQLPSHSHVVQCNTVGGNQASPQNGYPAVESTGTSLDFSSASNAQMNPQINSFVGGNQAHENRQPYLALNYCIAVQGIFPSRP
jgi:microcystin-dependent protein